MENQVAQEEPILTTEVPVVITEEKAIELADFRAEVKRYILTGNSSVLTTEERYKLSAQRKEYTSKGSWYNPLLNLFS